MKIPEKCEKCPTGNMTWAGCTKSEGGGGRHPGPECPYVLLAAKEDELCNLNADLVHIRSEAKNATEKMLESNVQLARLQNERNRFRNLLVQVRHETDSVPSNYVEDSVVSTATMCAGTIYDIRAAVEGGA